MTVSYVVGDTREHPATFSPSVLIAIEEILRRQAIRLRRPLRVIDPFAGIGGIHGLSRAVAYETVGVELEVEWADAHRSTYVGDATDLYHHERDSFDAVATSPAYGNRMADAYDGRDGSKRRSYRLSLGRPLSSDNGAAMQWGPEYRALHGQAIAEMMRVVRPGGLIVVNMSNHIRAGVQQRVVEWWVSALLASYSTLVEVRHIETPRYGFGANASARVDGEKLIVVRTAWTINHNPKETP